jgi:hypothetical protein
MSRSVCGASLILHRGKEDVVRRRLVIAMGALGLLLALGLFAACGDDDERLHRLLP